MQVHLCGKILSIRKDLTPTPPATAPLGNLKARIVPFCRIYYYVFNRLLILSFIWHYYVFLKLNNRSDIPASFMSNFYFQFLNRIIMIIVEIVMVMKMIKQLYFELCLNLWLKLSSFYSQHTC